MLEVASLGCQITYYMFDGGTNFAYWAGRSIVTSYQSNYPVREGGALSEKYYRLKPANHFITQFGAELADSEEVKFVATVTAGARLVVRKCPTGHLLFLSDASARPVTRLNFATKCSTSRGTSSARSRSGGSTTGKTLSRSSAAAWVAQMPAGTAYNFCRNFSSF